MAKDAYNFYHSQLRINIECAFGILVQRWGFLRMKAPINYTMKKVCAIVSCLCRLHNFLIDEKEGQPPVDSISQDSLNMSINGATPLSRIAEVRNIPVSRENRNVLLPEQLLNAGHHFVDDPLRLRRRDADIGVVLPREFMASNLPVNGLGEHRRQHRLVSQNGDMLPREAMFTHTVEGNYERPH